MWRREVWYTYIDAMYDTHQTTWCRIADKGKLRFLTLNFQWGKFDIEVSTYEHLFLWRRTLQTGNGLALLLYTYVRVTQYPAVSPEWLDVSGQNCSSVHSRQQRFRTRGRRKSMGPRNHVDTVVKIKNTKACACWEPPLGRPICRGTLQWISYRNSRFTKYRWVLPYR